MKNKNIDLDSLKSKYLKRCYNLNSEYLIKLNRSADQAQINNVICGLNQEFFSLAVNNDKEYIEYELIYGLKKTVLSGISILLDTKLSTNDRDCLVIMFAKDIAELSDQDSIDVYNTLQMMRRSLYEKYNYYTFNPTEFSNAIDKNPIIIAKNVKGIIPVRLVDKIQTYKNIFNFDKCNVENAGCKHVYLLFNARNNLTKIGQCIDPKRREKTLQGEEPEIHLLVAWKAPVVIEKKLHNKYIKKRVRGEWFDLSFKDLEEINVIMKNRQRKPMTNNI